MEVSPPGPGDVRRGLGVPFDPPRDLCAAVLARLFPWAPLKEWDGTAPAGVS